MPARTNAANQTNQSSKAVKRLGTIFYGANNWEWKHISTTSYELQTTIYRLPTTFFLLSPFTFQLSAIPLFVSVRFILERSATPEAKRKE